ncbi:MAG: hypothetical protein NC080_07535 [Paraprevotella sp.]|nr:hypothetical protein [Paraprevotella sp.]
MLKGIVLNVGEVQEILAGERTQLIRPLNPQPVLRLGGFWQFNGVHWRDIGFDFPKAGVEAYSPYLPGDELWVKEPFIHDEAGAWTIYRADRDADPKGQRWQPAPQMPRDKSRLMLNVQEVSAKRVAKGEDGVKSKEERPWVWVITFNVANKH